MENSKDRENTGRRGRGRPAKRELAFGVLIDLAEVEERLQPIDLNPRRTEDLIKAIQTICQEAQLLSPAEWHRPENPVNGPERSLPLPKYVDEEGVTREGWRFDPVDEEPQDGAVRPRGGLAPRAPHSHEQRMEFKEELQKLRDAGNPDLANQFEAAWNDEQRTRRQEQARRADQQGAGAVRPQRDDQLPKEEVIRGWITALRSPRSGIKRVGRYTRLAAEIVGWRWGLTAAAVLSQRLARRRTAW